jgi:nitrite reductase/ring-hydroxylating ferredoxin subunit
VSTAPAPVPWFDLPHAPAIGTVLGQRHALPDGHATMHTVDGPQPFRVLLLRSGDAVKVYANRCAHFGVPLAAKQEQLLFKPHISITCNVHYARYRWADGVCESGECEGESLIAIPVVVDAQGQIRIADPGAANATL